jgi:pimeloyl-ACP methyl ester carboxylesterase
MVGKDSSLRQAMLSGTPISSFKDLTKDFEHLKKMILPAPFEGNSVFELLGFNQRFSAEQAIFFHSLAGISDAKLAEEAGIATHPSARYYMVNFALGASQYAEVFAESDPMTIVLKYSQKFCVIQGNKDFLKISGSKKEALEAKGLQFYEVEECGHAVFLDTSDKLAKIIISLQLKE